MRTLDFADGFESEVQPTVENVVASDITFTPVGTIVSTDVQAALAELDVEKVTKVSSTDNAVPRFDGTDGAVQNSDVIIDDTNNITGVNDLTINGNLTVNGTTTTVNTTNLEVEDKLVALNKGGAAASAAGSGIEFEENGVKTAYVKTSSDRNAFEIKAPNTAGVASIIPGSGADEVALLAKAQSISNKTIDADQNTITNIKNTDIKAGAGIDVNKLAALTASRVAITDVSGFLTSADTATYPNLTELSYVKGATSSLQTQINSISGSSNPYKISNLSLAASVGSNALTIALKDANGSDPSGGSAVTVAFRNATVSTGTYTDVSVSAALSVVISSGSTLGHSNGVNTWLYIYLINNAGTAELAVSTIRHDDGNIVSTTAEGGAGAADSATAIYSTTGRSNVAIRLIGRMLVNQATAGTWASAPTIITVTPFEKRIGAQASRTEATNYQALSDGWFIGYAVSTNTTNGVSKIEGKTDASSPATVVYGSGVITTHANAQNIAAQTTSFVIPVKAGEYYRSDFTALTGSTGVTRSYYWRPYE